MIPCRNEDEVKVNEETQRIRGMKDIHMDWMIDCRPWFFVIFMRTNTVMKSSINTANKKLELG
jgi:hypothetical protein